MIDGETESEVKDCGKESYMWAMTLLLEKNIQSINLKYM